MAFRFCDSFDCYDVVASIAKKWTAVGGSGELSLSTTGGRFGGGCANNTGGAYEVSLQQNVSIASGATLYFGEWLMLGQNVSNGLSGSAPLFSVNAGNHVLGVDVNGHICLTAYGSTTILATGTTSVTDGNYHWVEFALNINGSSTAATLYVDGIQQFTGTAYAYAQAAIAITNVSFGYGYNFSGGPNNIDDVIVWDNSGTTFNTFPLGPRRIGCLNPSGAGTDTQFTPSTGTNWSCASQAYAGTKTLTSTTTGQTDTYATPGMAYTPTSTINAVVVNMYAENPAADGTKDLANVLLSSGTVARGTSRVLTGALVTYQDCFTTDSTGAAWTSTSVASAQPGIGD